MTEKRKELPSAMPFEATNLTIFLAIVIYIFEVSRECVSLDIIYTPIELINTIKRHAALNHQHVAAPRSNFTFAYFKR
jgi:hypothetical protein